MKIVRMVGPALQLVPNSRRGRAANEASLFLCFCAVAEWLTIPYAHVLEVQILTTLPYGADDENLTKT